MAEKTRGEQRFAAITYSQLAWWTGLKLSTIQSYGAKGFIPKDDMVATLQWVQRTCEDRKRPGPWQRYLAQQDQFARELGFWCYHDYLKSELWQEIRARILPADCRKCGKPADCVHHHRYTRENMSGESLKQLVPLCTPCHMKINHSYHVSDITPEGQGTADQFDDTELQPPIDPQRFRPLPSPYNPLTGEFDG